MGELVNFLLIVLKASSKHIEQLKSPSFLIGALIGSISVARSGRNFPMYCIIPLNPWYVGEKFHIIYRFNFLVVYFHAILGYYLSSFNNMCCCSLHLANSSCSFLSLAAVAFSAHSAMMMSSAITKTSCPNSASVNFLWNISLETLRPNGILTHLNRRECRYLTWAFTFTFENTFAPVN